MIKRIVSILLIALFLCSCSNSTQSVVGKWQDLETGIVVEYTADGYFYEYVNENFTTDKTNYRLENGKIVYYIKDVPEAEYAVEYEKKDGNLIIAQSIEYAPYGEQPEKNTQK